MSNHSSWITLKTAQLIQNGMLEIGDGYRAKNSELGLQGLPFARAGNIDGGFHFAGADILSQSSVRKAGNKISLPNDIVFTSKGTVGRFAFVKAHTPQFVYSPQICYWRVKDYSALDSRFLFFWMHGGEFKRQVDQVKGLTDMADYVSLTDQRRMIITAPPLPTQRRIAAVLSAYDDLIENNARRIAILEEMARNLYREWFVHFRFPGHEGVEIVERDGVRVPEGWEVTTVQIVSEYINRGVAPKYDDSSDSIVINQKCVRNSKINLEVARRHTTRIPTEKNVQFGDVLINSTGIGTLGRVAQIYQQVKNCTVDTHVTIVRPGKCVEENYFGFNLCSLEAHFDSQGIGSTGQTELSRSAIGRTQFVLPPLDLQKQFGEMVASMRLLTISLAAKNINLRRTRDLLLPRLMSGELDVSDLEIAGVVASINADPVVVHEEEHA